MDNDKTTTNATGSVTPIGNGARTENTIDSKAQQAAASAHSAVDRLADKVPAATEKVQAATEKVQATVDRLADKVPAATDRLVGKAHDTVDRMSDKAGEMSERLSQKAADLNVAYKRMAETGRSYVRQSPATSVLVAMAAGFVVSKLLGSRRH
jgi:ElaB/YqjD/DUF883 family membrane-anchored ribosome-binding protein